MYTDDKLCTEAESVYRVFECELMVNRFLRLGECTEFLSVY